MANIFTAPKDTSQQMADSLPRGRAWGKKNTDDSNTRKLINSLAVAHNSTQQSVELLDQEFRIDQTTNLIEEWERSVGLPSECKTSVGTIEQRRSDVIARIKRDPLVTLAQIQEYVDNTLPDLDVILYPGKTYTGFPDRATYTIAFDTGTNSNLKYSAFSDTPHLGRTVTCGMWVKNVDISTTWRVVLRNTPVTDEYGAYEGTAPMSTDWGYYTFEAVVPTSITGTLELLFDVSGSPEIDGQVCYFDDAFVGDLKIRPTDWTESADTDVSFSSTFLPSLDRNQILVAEVQSESETFIYDFTFPFTGGVNIDEFTCIMNKILPSNVLLLTYYI